MVGLWFHKVKPGWVGEIGFGSSERVARLLSRVPGFPAAPAPLAAWVCFLMLRWQFLQETFTRKLRGRK